MEIGKGLLTFLSIASRWERTNLGRNKPTKQERSWVFLQKPDMVFSPWMWCGDFIVWGLSWQMWGEKGPRCLKEHLLKVQRGREAAPGQRAMREPYSLSRELVRVRAMERIHSRSEMAKGGSVPT